MNPGAPARRAAVLVAALALAFRPAAAGEEKPEAPVLRPRLAGVRVGDWFRYRERPSIVRHTVLAVEPGEEDTLVRFVIEFFDADGLLLLTRSEMTGSLAQNREYIDGLNRQLAARAFPGEWKEVDIGGKPVRVLAMTFDPGTPDEIEAWWSEEISVTGLVMRSSRRRLFEDMLPLNFGNLYDDTEDR